jgi:hypothetical protein
MSRSRCVGFLAIMLSMGISSGCLGEKSLLPEKMPGAEMSELEPGWVSRTFNITVTGGQVGQAGQELFKVPIDELNRNCVGFDNIAAVGLERIRARATLTDDVAHSAAWRLGAFAHPGDWSERHWGPPPIEAEFDLRNASQSGGRSVGVVVYVYPADAPAAAAANQHFRFALDVYAARPGDVVFPDRPSSSCA